MSDAERHEIVQAWMDGTTLPELAHQYNATEQEIMQAVVREANRLKQCKDCDA